MNTKTFDSRDEFKRKPVAEKLISLLTSDIDISPMVIDGNWGSGKSEFCEKLINLIQEQHHDYQTIYLDAFGSDYSGEPLLALLAEIIKACTPEDNANQISPQRKQLIQRIANVGGFLFKTAAKAAISHLLKQNVDELSESLQEVLSKEAADKAAETTSDTLNKLSEQAIDATVEALLKEQVEAEKNLNTLKAILSGLAQEKPLIIFIDELDRCRPDYAVDMLETIKHIFDIKNITVVLITNMQQLQAAINHRYGKTVDAQRYLDKFIKFAFSLPEKSLAQYHYESVGTIPVSIPYFRQLSESSSILENTYFNDADSDVSQFTQKLIDINHLSLREVETLIRYLEIYHKLSQNFLIDKMSLDFMFLYIVGIFIFSLKPPIVQSIKHNQVDAKEIAKLFNFHSTPELLGNEGHYYAPRSQNIEVISVLMIQSCQINATDYVQFRNSEEQEKWKQFLMHRFSALSDRGKVFYPIKEVFSYLQLGKI